MSKKNKISFRNKLLLMMYDNVCLDRTIRQMKISFDKVNHILNKKNK
jgi:hypothetical protein